MWNKELLFVGTSWHGWGKLRFELSCVRKETAKRWVHKTRWGEQWVRGLQGGNKPGAEMWGWEKHRGAGEI